jgi:hypothetical protein
LSGSDASAIDAGGNGGIEFQTLARDFLVADQAKAVITRGKPFQGGLGALKINVPAPLGFLGHGLNLHRVHAGEPSDAGLIQFDGLDLITRAIDQAAKLGETGLQKLTKIVRREQSVER